MDPITGRDTLFSRGPSPPPQAQPFQMPPSQLSDAHTSPAPSFRDLAPMQGASHLDSLFQGLSAQPTSRASPQMSNTGSNVYSGHHDPNNSGHATPASMNAGSVASSMSGPNNPVTERQNALLSLLGAVSGPPSGAQAASGGGQAPPQQVPTPPGSAQRGAASSNETQGKLLLEQLMTGSAPKYNYPEPIYPPDVPVPPGPSPSYAHSTSASESFSHHDNVDHSAPEGAYVPQDTQRDAPNALGPPQQRPPSPPNRSMFDFISPFDALANTSSTAPKRKPPPSQQFTNAPVNNAEEPNWQSISMDPKRRSVENLMDQLTRGQAPPSNSVQQTSASFDPYATSEDFNSQAEPMQARASRPLPPQPGHVPSPPRTSPPKPQVQPRQARRSGESPVGVAVYGALTGRDKESPSMSVPAFRTLGPENRGRAGPKDKVDSPTLQSQSVIFDVSQPLDEIQAPHDAVKTTAIALVKVDSTFLPGSTIGATHWVAYAMTKGRVRVISRSSGDRTLLQLPPLFPPSTSVSDMSVHGNRLAGVTSDGGFVVWELPEIITDDVPGRLMLCVEPLMDIDPLHAVKWHPQRPELVAVASESSVYLINIEEAAHVFNGEPIPQSELHRLGQVFSVPSPIAAIDFYVPRSALATISEDSTVTMWNIHDKLPFWSHRIKGEETPSSLTFVDGGVVIGRKNGTMFELLSVMGRHVLSTIKFVNGLQEDPEMFGHVSYDSRIQTLWVANNRRDSMIALRINFDGPTHDGEDAVRGAFFEQVLEFGGPRPGIHFVILTADADPTGEEARAACVAAKVPPGDLALVAFSVHSTGVDQILIRLEWFTSALASAPSRFPSYTPQPAPAMESKVQRQQLAPVMTGAPLSQLPPPAPMAQIQPPRMKTPPSEEVEVDSSRDGSGRGQEPRGKNAKGKNVGWKDKDREDSGREKDGKSRGSDTAALNETPMGVALTKEIRKVEENLHTRIGRLIGKELDKQHQRLEEARANEQAADFVRQEKILKLISNELTKNTTRVVEMAVKSEVQSSVLPSLENITKIEVKAALNNQIAKGVSDSMKQNLPNEIERLLVRPDIASQIARNVSSAVTPVIERQVKDAIVKTLIPAYTQQSSTMHQELSREIHSEILNLKKEVISWQTEALRGQEAVIRDLEQAVRHLSDQVKYLTLNPSALAHSAPNRNSPGASSSSQHAQNLSQLLRQQVLPQVSQAPPYSGQPHGSFQQQQQQQQQPQQQPSMQPWFAPNIAAPQASHPAAPPPLPPQQMMRSSPAQTEEWDDTYVAVLGTQDFRQLRELLARSNPDVVLPLNGPGPLSQAVVLTLVHRLSALVGETSPLDESFKISMWWLQRAATALNSTDPLIAPYIARILPNVLQTLNSAKQRLSILPGTPAEAPRGINEIQEILNRKPMPLSV
ncbi:uncharacterized protein LAESUDRAFT_740929 [Laetiporus sulphureus 93-53]|uniref:Enhancer of mRNA-decapping protein 4 WD40 repeat region domain-containing protein n=1 Tax=Laetiporus sulphureus 93-53 TaxID=1314785 RepID=A0A165H9L5_9APHY|nr:uncharacterized protein LAESUDRAFT_740929 [Laetiporus sulphureus 93-53]KZT11432.1 hypothetical protein LAESUDRAFT_740929 [Laetiporus sulphureus 93-53]